MDFDLTGAPSGFYTLILGNASGADTLSNAVLVHNETVKLNRITTNDAADFTPDVRNNVIAFVSERDGQQDIYFQNLGLTDIAAYRLTNMNTVDSPSWNADGSQFVLRDFVELLKKAGIGSCGGAWGHRSRRRAAPEGNPGATPRASPACPRRSAEVNPSG